MKTWLAIGALALSQLIVIAYGIPFHINVGTVQVSSNMVSYVTTSRTLASFILTAEKSELTCEKSPSICVQVSNPEGIGPFMPIQFEACNIKDAEIFASCNRPHLELSLNTAKWIQTSLGRRL